MKIFVGIASTGRNAIIDSALRSVARQSLSADRVIICTPEQEPFRIEPDAFGLAITHLRARKGSCSQRNAVLDAVKDEAGVLVIIDDDFLLHEAYLRIVRQLAAANPDVALINGRLLKDGIIGPGLTVTEAEDLLARHTKDPVMTPSIRDKVAAYGCNMAIRLEHSRMVRFDENLPLYGWQEDVDYSARLSRHGRIVDTDAISGVHLGVKLGRTSGIRFGYSQVINPIYLARKGTMRTGHVLRLVARNILMNVSRTMHPEPYIDRRGRLRGNLLAIKDLVFGRIDPLRVLQVE